MLNEGGGRGLLESKHISIVSRGNKIILNSSTVLYVLMAEKIAEIHVSSGKTYETRMTLGELEEKLGEGFIKIHRGCIVSVMAIHDITDKINLSNGESLSYTVRKKKQIMEQFLSQFLRIFIFYHWNCIFAHLQESPCR